jgi:hypothetical protein
MRSPAAVVEFARTVGALAGHAVVFEPTFLETGIKVIDVTCWLNLDRRLLDQSSEPPRRVAWRPQR